MFGFLLAWNSEQSTLRANAFRVVFMAGAFASAFGLSIYVAFAFFLVMLPWVAWQLIASRRAPRPVLYLAAGAVGSA